MKFWKRNLAEPGSEGLVNEPVSDIIMLTEFEGLRDAAEVLIKEYVAACNRNGCEALPELLDIELIYEYMLDSVSSDMVADMMDTDFDRGVILGKIIAKVEIALREEGDGEA